MDQVVSIRNGCDTERDLRRVGVNRDHWYPLAWSPELKPGKSLAVRFAGVSAAILGLVLAARAPTLAPKLLGVAIVLSALVVIAVVPASLAHRWRSDDA